MKNEESKEQQTLVEWFRMQWPRELIFAIPNGGSRNIVEATQLKRSGVLAGIPDLCVPYPKEPYHALYVEYKTLKGKPSSAQLLVIEYLRMKGYKAVICYGLEEAMEVVKAYMESGE